MRRYRTGIVGCGRIAGYLEDDPLRDHPCTHAGTYRSMDNIRLISCSGNSMESSLKFAARFGIPHYYNDLHDMLSNHELDILSICTPAEYHVPLVVQAAESKRVKAVYCEKALALSLSEAEQAITACRDNGVVLAVNYLRRWSNNYIMVKELIEKDAIGEVQTVHGIFSGNIMHTGTHMFDILLYLFGQPEWVEAELEKCLEEEKESSGYKFVRDDHFDDPNGRAHLKFLCGTDVFISAGGKKYFIFEMDIIGSRGRIRIGNFLQELWLPRASMHYKDFSELEKVPFPLKAGSRNGWFNAVDDILSQIGGKAPVGATGEDAYRSMEIAFGMALSSSYSGSRITFPLQEKDMSIVSK